MEWWAILYMILDLFSRAVLPQVFVVVFLIGLLKQKYKYLLWAGIIVLIMILFKFLDGTIFAVEVLPVNYHKLSVVIKSRNI